MNRRFLGRIPVTGQKNSRGNDDRATRSERSRSSTVASGSGAKKLRTDEGQRNFKTATNAASNSKTKENVKNLFETSMDISFSLSSQIHSTPVESSKYAKKAANKLSEKPALRPAASKFDSEKDTTNTKDVSRSTRKETPDGSRRQSSPRVSPEKLQLSAWGLPDIFLQRYAEKGVTTMFEWQEECLCTPGVLAKEDISSFSESLRVGLDPRVILEACDAMHQANAPVDSISSQPMSSNAVVR